MRVLYVTNGFPYPLTSGLLRHYHFIRHLAACGHSVILLSLVGPSFQKQHEEALQRLCQQVHVFEEPANIGLRKYRKAVRRLTSALPEIRRMARCAGQLVEASRFDVLLLSGKDTLPVAEVVGSLPIVADICDAASARIRRWLPHDTRWKRPLRMLELLHMRRVERKIALAASHCVFASQRDLDDLQGEARLQRASVIPNGVDTTYWCRQKTQHEAGTIIFTGAMDYPPNTDAALQLADKILPLVRRKLPDARLLIVGRDPPESLRNRHRPGVVEVTGLVDDLRPYLEQASVYAAPLRFGAGIQNKLLEALAMELPVVTSALAAEGLQAGASRPPLTVAGDEHEFAERLVDQLTHRGITNYSAGRRYVQENFDWHQKGRQLESLLREVSARGAGTGTSGAVDSWRGGTEESTQVGLATCSRLL